MDRKWTLVCSKWFLTQNVCTFSWYRIKHEVATWIAITIEDTLLNHTQNFKSKGCPIETQNFPSCQNADDVCLAPYPHPVPSLTYYFYLHRDNNFCSPIRSWSWCCCIRLALLRRRLLVTTVIIEPLVFPSVSIIVAPVSPILVVPATSMKPVSASPKETRFQSRQ
jgi:hypothetical protein